MHAPRSKLLSAPVVMAGMLCAFLAGYFAPASLRDPAMGNTSAPTIPPSHGITRTTMITEDLGALQTAYQSTMLPIFEQYCFDCHADGARRGGLAMDAFDSIQEMRADRESWKRIRSHLEFRLMPPADKEQPGDDEIQTLIAWIDEAIFPVDADNPEPGRITVRRLNRNEYANTIRDLLGVEIDPKRLPPDDSGYGFDHIGDVLTLAPTHLERYQEIAFEALWTATQPPMPMPILDAPGRAMRGSGHRQDNSWFIYTNGTASIRTQTTTAGEYTLRISLSAHQAGDENAKATIHINGKEIETVDVRNHHPKTQDFVFPVALQRGTTQIAIEFINDYYRKENQRTHDRNLFVHHIRVDGPNGSQQTEHPPFHQRWFHGIDTATDPISHALKSLGGFMRLAFRRPVAAAEITRFRPLIEAAIAAGDPPDEAMRLAMEAVLISPDFLFRELSMLTTTSPSGTIEAISEIDLASRLSYFLWASTPDERLINLAENNHLRDHLIDETKRLLEDPRADAFIENFFLQWLRVRDIEIIQPDGVSFPEFDDNLRQAMLHETLEFVRHIIREDLSITTLLDADFTFVNPKLAAHYGLPHPGENSFQKVSLINTPRRGILTHASILTLTSHPTRTSPVKRGEWILDILLDTAPPPPPPNVPSLESQTALPDDAPLRDRLEAHRSDPSCSSCHALMDGIGYAFEHFDAIGRWRDRDGSAAIDPRGTLATGETFATPTELAEVLLKSRHDLFLDSFSARLLTYALGRGLDYYDKPTIAQITASAAKQEFRPKPFIHAVVQSKPFQFRKIP